MSLTPRSGGLLQRYLFSPLYTPADRWAVIRWWESRRPFYNIVVGAAGLVTIATAVMMRAFTPSPELHRGPPLILVAGYALAANLLYSLGAPIDLLLRKRLREHAGPVAQVLFRYGLALSVGLTLLPIPLLIFGTIMMLLTH